MNKLNMIYPSFEYFDYCYVAFCASYTVQIITKMRVSDC